MRSQLHTPTETYSPSGGASFFIVFSFHISRVIHTMSLNFVDLRLTASTHTISLNDLAIDPKFQMRTEMNHETIAEYAEKIDAICNKNPIEVVSVEHANGEEVWYLVDGFHRYHAARLAEKQTIKAVVMQGSYKEARQYAMTANLENGLQPTQEDLGRAIGMVLETEEFGLNSKLVVPFLMELGFSKRSAQRHSASFREGIEAKRDAKIVSMSESGASSRQVAAETGVSQRTVSSIVAASKTTGEQNAPVAQNAQTEEDAPFFFDEDELDTTPAINPADAFNKTLADHERKRRTQSASTLPINPINGAKSTDNNYGGTLTQKDTMSTPWSWTSTVAEILAGAFSDLSIEEMADKLKADAHALEQFKRVQNYMERVTAFI